MARPAAIMGQLVDAKNIAVHKTLRLSIDIPVEQAQAVLNAFGWPTMANPVPIAIARLDSAVAIEQSIDEPEKIKGGKLCQKAAIYCGEGAFRTFLAERDTELNKHFTILDKELAVDEVRAICGVKSRSEIDGNETASRKFKDLEREYKAWMLAA